MSRNKSKLERYFFEFLSVFIAVIAAFGLNNWSEYRRDTIAEEKILIEIRNGLKSDLEELKINKEADDYSDLAHFIDILNNTPDEDLVCELDKHHCVYIHYVCIYKFNGFFIE